VGPFRVEVIEGLERLRFIDRTSEHSISCDLTWRGAVPAYREPRSFPSQNTGRVVFDTSGCAKPGLLEWHAHGRRRDVRRDNGSLVGGRATSSWACARSAEQGAIRESAAGRGR